MSFEHPDPTGYPAMARELDAHPDYRVLRRFEGPVYHPHEIPGDRRRTALILDCETTGLETTDKVIEIGMLLVEFDRETGKIGAILETLSGFEDPGEPLSPEITKITGITDADVKDHQFNDEAVERLASRADLVIAHNAGFDRKMMEARFPVFERSYWACSFVDIPWSDLGFVVAKQEYIAMMLGTFYDAHRALVDCEVLASILNYTYDGETFLSRLLDRASQPIHRVWANGAPFDVKDQLKARGYRWSPGDNGSPKSWYRDILAEQFDDERQWLRENIMQMPPYYVAANGYIRFSERMDDLGLGKRAETIP